MNSYKSSQWLGAKSTLWSTGVTKVCASERHSSVHWRNNQIILWGATSNTWRMFHSSQSIFCYWSPSQECYSWMWVWELQKNNAKQVGFMIPHLPSHKHSFKAKAKIIWVWVGRTQWQNYSTTTSKWCCLVSAPEYKHLLKHTSWKQHMFFTRELLRITSASETTLRIKFTVVFQDVHISYVALHDEAHEHNFFRLHVNQLLVNV